MKKHIANIITLTRIVISILMTAFPVFSTAFYLSYIFAGLSDMADGAIARTLKTESKTGAVLDSLSDIVFAAVCAVKFLPVISMSIFIWIWIALIAAIRITNIIMSFFLYKKPVMLHTIANKITGFLIFIFFIVIKWISQDICAVFICLCATFASVQEGIFIKKGKILPQNEKG